MKKLVLILIATALVSAKAPAPSSQKIALGTFSGSTASLCYTNSHLAFIMTYFIDKGKVYYNTTLQHNETEGFYLEGTTKNNNSYEMTRVTLAQESGKLYLTTKSKIYYCATKIEGDCVLSVRKLEGGRVTRYEPSSKSGQNKDLIPGSYAGVKKELPANLVNYINNLNIADCN
jgi:hypothetical protein